MLEIFKSTKVSELLRPDQDFYCIEEKETRSSSLEPPAKTSSWIDREP
jgi:hypothetical protein